MSDESNATTTTPTPFPTNGTDDGKVCPLCQQMHVGGRFQPGCPGPRLAHGLYAARLPAEVEQQVGQFTAAVVADLGGEDELSTIERGYIQKLAAVEAPIHLLVADIAERGLLTPTGGVRRAFDSLLLAIDRWDRLAQRLGTKRRARHVRSLAEAIAQAPEVGRE